MYSSWRPKGLGAYDEVDRCNHLTGRPGVAVDGWRWEGGGSGGGFQEEGQWALGLWLALTGLVLAGGEQGWRQMLQVWEHCGRRWDGLKGYMCNEAIDGLGAGRWGGRGQVREALPVAMHREVPGSGTAPWRGRAEERDVLWSCWAWWTEAREVPGSSGKRGT